MGHHDLAMLQKESRAALALIARSPPGLDDSTVLDQKFNSAPT
jgi:hypothetical protein